ncbi:MAG: hypothetical protein ACMUEM_01305 [Flavobacteriales bacterium AspAUS03]
MVSATEVVGLTIFELLANKATEIKCMTSSQSIDKKIKVKGIENIIKKFSIENCSDYDIIFLCVSSFFSKIYTGKLSKKSYVIDNSSAFRYDEKVPLLVPPVNGFI